MNKYIYEVVDQLKMKIIYIIIFKHKYQKYPIPASELCGFAVYSL